MPVRAVALAALALALLTAAACTPARPSSPSETTHTTVPKIAKALTTAAPPPQATDGPPVSQNTAPVTTKNGTRTTTLQVPRHDLDLPTFMDAAAQELAREPRITVSSAKIDGELRDDGAPVAVIAFEVDATHAAGKQYIRAHDDGLHFFVATCVAQPDDLPQCDEAATTDPAEVEMLAAP